MKFTQTILHSHTSQCSPSQNPYMRLSRIRLLIITLTNLYIKAQTIYFIQIIPANFAHNLNSLTIFDQSKRHIEDNFNVFFINNDFFYKVSYELFALRNIPTNYIAAKIT